MSKSKIPRTAIIGIWVAVLLVLGGCGSGAGAEGPASGTQDELLQPAEQASDAVGIANDAIEQQQGDIEELGTE